MPLFQVVVAYRYRGREESEAEDFHTGIAALAQEYGVTYSGSSSGGGELDLEFEHPRLERMQSFMKAAKAMARGYKNLSPRIHLDDMERMEHGVVLDDLWFKLLSQNPRISQKAAARKYNILTPDAAHKFIRRLRKVPDIDWSADGVWSYLALRDAGLIDPWTGKSFKERPEPALPESTPQQFAAALVLA